MKKKKKRKIEMEWKNVNGKNNSKNMKSISNQVHDLARFFILKLLMFLPSL